SIEVHSTQVGVQPVRGTVEDEGQDGGGIGALPVGGRLPKVPRLRRAIGLEVPVVTGPVRFARPSAPTIAPKPDRRLTHEGEVAVFYVFDGVVEAGRLRHLRLRDAEIECRC